MPTQQREGVAHRRVDSSHAPPIPVACRQQVPQVTPVIEDRKSAHATALAIELATTRSWAEELSQSTSTNENDLRESMTNMQSTWDSRDDDLNADTYHNPPPAYSSHANNNLNEDVATGSVNRLPGPWQVVEGVPAGPENVSQPAPHQNSLDDLTREDPSATGFQNRPRRARPGSALSRPQGFSRRGISFLCFVLILIIGIMLGCHNVCYHIQSVKEKRRLTQ